MFDHYIHTEPQCCKHNCRTKAEMRKLHGTPEAFWADLMVAYADLFITMPEAERAAQRYREVYLQAPE